MLKPTRSRSRFNPSISSQIPFTREGLAFLLTATLLLVTGLLKGINLITLFACAMFVVVVLNFFLARRQLRRIDCRRYVIEPAFAGQKIPVVIEVVNDASHTRSGLLVCSVHVDDEETWFVPKIESKQGVTYDCQLSVNKRGLCRLGPLSLACGFPIGFVYHEHFVEETQEVVVLPRLGELQRGALRRLLSCASPTSGKARMIAHRNPTAQTEIYGLREFRQGDSTRWVHWRTSARRGQLVVCEFEELPSDHLTLVFDPYQPFAGADKESIDRFETAVSLAATVCWEWCRQKGNPIALGIASTAEPFVQIGVTGEAFALGGLRRLASVKREKEGNYEFFVTELLRREVPQGPILVISTYSRGLQERLSEQLRRKVACINLAEDEFSDYIDLRPA